MTSVKRPVLYEYLTFWFIYDNYNHVNEASVNAMFLWNMMIKIIISQYLCIMTFFFRRLL